MRTFGKFLWPLLLSVVLLGACARTGNTIDLATEDMERIDLLFKDVNDTTPGYAVGISIQGRTVLAKGYGSANLEHGIPITSASAFDIASVSKQFTAAGIALLILEGRLSMETPAAEFIPELSKYGDTIRVKHLVYNTSGLVDYHRLPRVNGRSWITFNYFDIDECIATSLSVDTLAFTPGTKWDYCNVNFMLLTRIIELVSGSTFSAYIRMEVFEPLGMKNTVVNDDITNVIRNRVMPYNVRSEENRAGYQEQGIALNARGGYIQHPRTSPHYGGSGIVTTVDDLLIWSRNMLTKEFGGETFHELMHRTPRFAHDRNNQAMGLYRGNYRDRRTVAWDGGDWGVSSQLLRFPDQGVAIVVLSNLGSGEAYRKAEQIADVLIDGGRL